MSAAPPIDQMSMQADQMMLEPELGDKSKVEEVLLPWLNEQAKHALTQMQSFHSSCEAIENAFRGDNSLTDQDSAGDLGTIIELREAFNQTRVVTAVMNENMFANSDMFRVQAENGELQSRADATASIMRAMLRDGRFLEEAYNFWYRFNKYDMAGLEIVVSFDDYIEHVRETLGVQEAEAKIAKLTMENEQAADNFGAEDAAQPRPFRVIDRSDVQPDGTYTKIIIETPEVRSKVNIYIKALEPRNFALSDPKEPDINRQFSIHKFMYYNHWQLDNDPVFRNVDKIGAPNSRDRHHPRTISSVPFATGTGATPQKAPLWEITKSDAPPPWPKWLRKGRFTVPDLRDFAQFYGFDLAECFVPSIWEAWHKEQEVLLHIRPTINPRRVHHNYRIASWVHGDSEAIGQGFFRIVKPLSDLKSRLANMYFDNTRQRMSLAGFINTMSPLEREKVAELRKSYDMLMEVEIPSGQLLKEQLITLSELIPDCSAQAMTLLSYVDNQGQMQGAPAVIQGFGDSETATQDSMNDRRGQQKIDDPFRRAVFNAFVPMWEMQRDLIFRHFDNARFISIAGEEGVALGKSKWVNPEMITNRFVIIPLASFEFMDRRAKAQSLIMAMNILAQDPTNPILLKQYALFLEVNGWDRWTINYLTNNLGAGTNPDEEIMVMVNNTEEDMASRIRPTDNNIACLQAASRAIAEYPQLTEQWNFTAYIQKHMDEMAAKWAMAMQMGTGAQGPPMQPNPNPPMDEESATRSEAQSGSPPDDGMAQAGLTGAAMPPGGEPA